ncbi:ABC transporter permease [Georgenia faecalis]|uniref:ABC transporter permease n=1 Tax=Georgenia faecalis TaxID=2483799 RepID=UPI000FDC25CE|nr:ABC transporter permease [Georgenia faecalis]
MTRSSVAALVHKDLRITWRSPMFALISVLVPVAFTLLYAVVIHVSTTAPIAIADEDGSDRSRQLIAVMEDMHNDDGPYYEVLTTDPAEAWERYADGTVGAVLTIPSGFAADVDARRATEVGLALVNINADGTKNQHLRLEQAMRTFNEDAGVPAASRLAVTEEGVLDRDIPITVYLGAALVVFAALYSGIVNAGVAIAREWEDRTAKSLVLSPAGPVALIAGKWLSVLVTSLVTISVAALGIGAVLGFPLTRLGPHSLVVLAVVWLYGLGIGTLLGVILRKSLPLVPIAVILAVGHFLVCGYESYLRGFAHGGVAEVLWTSTRWIPLAPLFDAVRFEAAALPTPAGLPWGLAASALIAVGLTALAADRLARTGTFAQGQ